jgi:hypothetical protein
VEELELSSKTPTFEALWRTYGYARGKKEARAAWKALPADTDLAAVIEAATAWQQSWAAQGKPNAPRYTLAKWLKDERHDEDAPKGFQKMEGGKIKVIDENNERPAKTTRKQSGPVTARITAADVVVLEFGSSELHFTVTDEAGVEHNRVITLEHPDGETQYEGQQLLARLVTAAGLNQIEDSAELLGRTIVMHDDRFSAPVTRPGDDGPQRIEPEPTPPPRHMTVAEAEREAYESYLAEMDDAA